MSPPPASSAPGGFAGSLRSFGETLNETVRVRGALFAVELREEVSRRTRTLVLGALAFAALHTALLVMTLLVVVLFWDTYRVGSVAGLAVLYLACGAVALVKLRLEREASPAPFEATLREFQRDLADMRSPE